MYYNYKGINYSYALLLFIPFAWEIMFETKNIFRNKIVKLGS